MKNPSNFHDYQLAIRQKSNMEKVHASLIQTRKYFFRQDWKGELIVILEGKCQLIASAAIGIEKHGFDNWTHKYPIWSMRQIETVLNLNGVCFPEQTKIQICPHSILTQRIETGN